MSDSETLIKVDNVGKKFCRDLKRSLWYGAKDVGKELLGRAHGTNGHLRRDEFWAVQDINFEVKRGECMGLIGRNGAGKSTLLKMLNGLLKPDTGRIEMHGRVNALIELGAGFNPILTGRENIHIAGSLRGFSNAEIRRKFDDIVDFAEIGDFIDMPVKNYSSGMKVRLGFAVAAQMEPDVLLIDEVLAVGDIGFKIKCFNEIFQIVRNAAVIFVSHQMPQIGRLCNRGMVLKDGHTACVTDHVPEAIHTYHNLFGFLGMKVFGSGRARILGLGAGPGPDITIYPPEAMGQGIVEPIQFGEDLYIDVLLEVDDDVPEFKLSFGFNDMDQRSIAGGRSPNPLPNKGGVMRFRTRVPALPLSPGKYALTVSAAKAEKTNSAQEFLVNFRDAIVLHVQDADLKTTEAAIRFIVEWEEVPVQSDTVHIGERALR